MASEVKEAANRALQFTSQLVDEIGPRPSGSEESRKAADILRERAGTFADKAWTEDFVVHPKAFLGWIRILVVIYFLALAMLWLPIYWVAALLTSVGLIILIGQFFLYRELIDSLFPKRTGRNVMATVEPQDEPKGQLIVSGHHDSAFVFNFLVHQPSLYPVRVTGGIASIVGLLIVSWLLTLWQVTTGEPPGWSVYAAAVFSVLCLLVGQLWWFASSQSTPGAGDNLASTAAAWEVLKIVAALKAEGTGMRHLRIIAASWDAEEAGLRGARHWAKSYAGDLQELPTWNLNLECLYDKGELFLLTSDVNGSVTLSSSLAERCQRLMSDHGLNIPAKPIAFLTGGTDAGEIARGGGEATSLIGMPWGNSDRSAVYHTPADLPGTVDPLALEEAIQLALDLAQDLDRDLV